VIKGIYIAANSLYEKQKNLEVVANNLANINTVGYKKEGAFAELMSRFDQNDTKQTNFTDYSGGSMTQTQNPFDMAIEGNAYFMVKTPDNNIEMTKNGKFSIDQNGYIVNEQGGRVQGSMGDINIGNIWDEKNKSIEITQEGLVRIGGNKVDTLAISKVTDPTLMQRNDGLNFTVSEGDYSEAEPNEFKVMQGFLEGSNVNSISEMQSMIQIDRSFNSIQKVMNTLDETMQQGNQVGRL